TVNAQDWQKLDAKLVDNYKGHAIAADFYGNNTFDLYHTGNYSTEWAACKRGWGVESITSMIKNNGDGTYTLDWNEAINFADPTWNPDSYVDGEPNNTYMRWPNHNIPMLYKSDFVAADINNDGLFDLVVICERDVEDTYTFWGGGCKNDAGEEAGDQIAERRGEKLSIFINKGEGKFELMRNTGLVENCGEDGDAVRAVSAGDYDRDGYIDIIVSGMLHSADYEKYCNEGNQYDRFVKLYHNNGNVGADEAQFTEVFIAETTGGVWTRGQKEEDSDEYAVEPVKLDGYFPNISGSVQFADFNNDGWLDVVIAGYGETFDVYKGKGTIIKMFLNQNGEKFVDITDQNGSLESLNNSCPVIADFNKDGYLDILNSGYAYHIQGGWHSFLYPNDFANDPETIFSSYLSNQLDGTGLPAPERGRCFASDFDNDGNIDVYYASGVGHAAIYYGLGDYSFEEDDTDMGEMKNDGDHFGTIADFNGDGIADLYVPHERGWENDATVVPNPRPAAIYINNMVSGAVEAPEAPTAVAYTIEDGKINITWNYDTEAAVDANLAYNIFVKFADGSVYTLIPADIETGFVKVSEGKHVALRPTLTSYSITNSNAVAEVGVQAVSLNNYTFSKFAKGSNAGIDNVIADSESDATPVYYNMQGIRIENPAKGQNLIKVQGDKATKIVF
ncbi:MAG: VCBS repeat-containing protein, partial [Muribaculaceae bacterium]|nr:VCBS repeat-containing protein [Muribaculaceae bacterium]